MDGMNPHIAALYSALFYAESHPGTFDDGEIEALRAAIALMRGQSEKKPMETNMHKTIYDLAMHCGADVDGGEYPDHSENFAGSPPTITFTDRQLEKFAEKLLDGSYLYADFTKDDSPLTASDLRSL